MMETHSLLRSSRSVMANRLALILLCCVPAWGQFGNPYPQTGGGIGFPGGGISLPGQGRGRSGQSNRPMENLSGKIRRMSTTQLILTRDDSNDVSVALDRNTRYYDNVGNNARFGDFENGDVVSVDATLDNMNLYHGLRVTMIRRGTPDPAPGTSSSSSGSGDDSDQPKLKRADTSVAAPAKPGEDPDRPRLSRNATTVAPPPVPREADDPGPPVLRRDAPARVDTTPPAGASRPSIKAEDSNGVTRPPAPPTVGNGGSRDSVSSRPAPESRPGDPVINSARDAAFEFTDTLPNYVVKQFTTRYESDTAQGNRTSWRALDVVTADVVAEGGKETYRNILVNGKPPRDAIEKTGSWSTGEFATVLQGILHPSTDADFHNKRSTTIVNRPAWRYDYSVEQPRSMWHVYASQSSYVPGYTGSIWIDKATYRVLRIEMSAVDMPKSFALDAVESAVDYDYVLIGEQKYLLPVHSEALSCVRGTSECTRNVIDFRNYKKFSADTSITFDK